MNKALFVLGLLLPSLGACSSVLPVETTEQAGVNTLNPGTKWQGPRLLLRLQDGQQPDSALVASLSRAGGLLLRPQFAISPNLYVFESRDRLSEAALANALQRLRAHPAVVYAEPDRAVRLP
ncbi:hypothetical protein [Thermithiobacillus plumbiphilus]|uniref:Lipoprotein n=1 Tax=Thermithiobacillus plumbiphilus TaxID=1729899 RepID=A0ABU9D3Y3_9PROT